MLCSADSPSGGVAYRALDMKDNGGARQHWPCDYCGEVATALRLSRKHVRAPLYAGCATCPAAARVAAGGGESAFLCADCDDGCEGAARVPMEGFAGCPAAAELAASTSSLAAVALPRSVAASTAVETKRMRTPSSSRRWTTPCWLTPRCAGGDCLGRRRSAAEGGSVV